MDKQLKSAEILAVTSEVMPSFTYSNSSTQVLSTLQVGENFRGTGIVIEKKIFNLSERTLE